MRVLAIALGILLAGPAAAGEEALSIPSFDGYALDAKLSTPAAGASKLILLIHGSGPNDMDEDLTAATKDRKRKLLFFKDLSDVLVAQGFGVLRYHKRTYQFRLSMQQDPGFRGKPAFSKFIENPLRYLVDDAGAMTAYLRKRFPTASIHLLGHSQGTYIGLQLAHRDPRIAGVALVGFALTTLDTLVFEQVVHRPLRLMRKLDTNGDELLDRTELAGKDDPVAGSLLAQLAVIDLDGDGKLSFAEIQAGNLSNVLLRDIIGQAYRQQEARYPRIATILAGTKAKVAWFQGEWDNQTPAYQARAVQLVNKMVWKNDRFRFRFFPRLGHALDARESYDDLYYQPPDTKALQALAAELKALF